MLQVKQKQENDAGREDKYLVNEKQKKQKLSFFSKSQFHGESSSK